MLRRLLFTLVAATSLAGAACDGSEVSTSDTGAATDTTDDDTTTDTGEVDTTVDTVVDTVVDDDTTMDTVDDTIMDTVDGDTTIDTVDDDTTMDTVDDDTTMDTVDDDTTMDTVDDDTTMDTAMDTTVADACTPNPCTVPPAPTCDGNGVVASDAAGTCTDDNGTAVCDYAELAPVDCGAQFCTDGACNDWRLAGAGDLVITEIMHSPRAIGDNDGEWFELLSGATDSINLKGLVVHDEGSNTFTVDADVIVAPDAYVVLGKSDDITVNGGVTVAFAYGGSMALSAGDEIIIERDMAVVDAVDWDPNDDFPIREDASMSLTPDRDATANDTGGEWCLGYTAYGAGDFGTPGAPNDPCALPLDWCRLQFPPTTTLRPGETVDVFGRVFVPGLTDIDGTNNTHPLVQGDVGYGPTGSMPDTWTEWTAGTPNPGYDSTGEPANDEYMALLTAPARLTAGDELYDYAFRFTGDGGRTFTYCDRATGTTGEDGSENGYQPANAGVLTVEDPCTPNPCTFTPSDTCDGDALSTFAAAGVCNAPLDGASQTCTHEPAVTNCGDTSQRCDTATLACVDCLTNADCTGPFEVCGSSKTCDAGCQDDRFVGNIVGNPEVLTGNTQEAGLVLCNGTTDAFSFDLGVGDSLGVTVSFVAANGVISAVVADASGMDVATAALGTDETVITYTVQTAGVHTLRIEGAENQYDLLVTFTDDPCIPNPCTAVPGPECQKGDAVTYTFACAPADGACTYPEATRVTCADFCNKNGCTDWRYVEAIGDLVITEVMIDPNAVDDTVGEYFEVQNQTMDQLNLDGLDVFDLNTPPESFNVTGDLLVDAGESLVFGLSDDIAVNGGVAVDYVYTGMVLDEAADVLALAMDAADIDDVIWDDTTFPVTNGAAMSLNPDRSTTVTNDYPVAWCEASSALTGGDTGTPGATNDACTANYPIDFCRLERPIIPDVVGGTTIDVFGRVMIDGLTNINLDGNDVEAGVLGAVGYGPAGTDPAVDVNWVWTAGQADPAYVVTGNANMEPTHDEYLASVDTPLVGGTYDLAYRFSGDDGATWQYCDTDGVALDGSELYETAEAGILTVTAPPVPVLVITEYAEGSSSNKALELTNFDSTPIDLAANGCEFRFYGTPGATHTESTLTTPLTGSVAVGDTFVLCNPNLDPTLFTGTCDQSTTSNSWFNGDDPVELNCNGVSVDWVGQTGVDISFGPNRTLKRKCDVLTGDPVGDDAFDPADEWVESPSNTFSDFGKREPPTAGSVSGTKDLVIDAVDLVNFRIRLRNVSAAAVDVTTAWTSCNFPNYDQITNATVSIAVGELATLPLNPGIGLSVGGSGELAIYESTSFGSSEAIVDYLAINAGDFTREGVATGAGVWTAGDFITLDATLHSGVVLIEGGDATGQAGYAPVGLGCALE